MGIIMYLPGEGTEERTAITNTCVAVKSFVILYCVRRANTALAASDELGGANVEAAFLAAAEDGTRRKDLQAPSV